VLTFAGGGAWEKTRRLPEPSAHEDDLRMLAYRLMDAAGLQRGRLTAIALKGEDLISADQVTQQISLDDARACRLVARSGPGPRPRQVRLRNHRPGRRLPPRLLTPVVTGRLLLEGRWEYAAGRPRPCM
jgi:hypothetical protein